MIDKKIMASFLFFVLMVGFGPAIGTSQNSTYNSFAQNTTFPEETTAPDYYGYYYYYTSYNNETTPRMTTPNLTTTPGLTTEETTIPDYTEYTTTPGGFHTNFTDSETTTPKYNFTETTTPKYNSTTHPTTTDCVEKKPDAKAKCKHNFSNKHCIFLEKHNSLRKRHKNTKCLVLCPDLNKSAQKYAEKMIKDDLWRHSENRNYGENLFMIWWGPGDKTGDEDWILENIKKSVQSWYDEIDDYDFKTGKKKLGSENKMIGHFTQLVWKEAKRLGFGYKVFYNRFGDGKEVYGGHGHKTSYMVVVGHYDIGNVVGEYLKNVEELKEEGNCTKIDKNQNCEFDCDDEDEGYGDGSEEEEGSGNGYDESGDYSGQRRR